MSENTKHRKCSKTVPQSVESNKTNSIPINELDRIQTISQNGSKCHTKATNEDINENNSHFRSKLNYLLDNIKKVKDSKKLHLIETEVREIDFEKLLEDCDSPAIGPNESMAEDYEDFAELKNRGEEDIRKSLTTQEFNETILSLETITCLKSLSFEQICCLINSFANVLRQISIHSNSNSFFIKIFEKSGYQGIPANIQLSLFSKSQKTYIIGCLNGIFGNDKEKRSKMFAILFPETLVRIVMKINKLSYCKALALIKPKAVQQLR